MGVSVEKNTMMKHCVVVGTPVCTIQFSTGLEEIVLGYIGIVQKAHP